MRMRKRKERLADVFLGHDMISLMLCVCGKEDPVPFYCTL